MIQIGGVSGSPLLNRETSSEHHSFAVDFPLVGSTTKGVESEFGEKQVHCLASDVYLALGLQRENEAGHAIGLTHAFILRIPSFAKAFNAPTRGPKTREDHFAEKIIGPRPRPIEEPPRRGIAERGA